MTQIRYAELLRNYEYESGYELNNVQQRWAFLAAKDYADEQVKNLTIPVVSNNEVAVCSQCGKDKYLHPLIADEGLCICNVKQTDC